MTGLRYDFRCAVLRGWRAHRHPDQHPAQVVQAVRDPRRPRCVLIDAEHQLVKGGTADELSCCLLPGSFVDYSVPYTNDCRLIHNAMQLALQQERQRDATATKTLAIDADERSKGQ